VTAARLEAAAEKRARRAQKRARDFLRAAANENRTADLISRTPRPILSAEQLDETNLGVRHDVGTWAGRRIRYEALLEQTERLAAALERSGIPAKSTTPAVEIDLAWGTIDSTPAWRPIKFLPVVAQRDTAPMRNALLYFTLHHVLGKYARMATITTGGRVPVGGDLRGRLKKSSRDISRWAHECDTEWGVSVLFRGAEFPRKVECQGEERRATYHVHQHVIYTPRPGMTKARWRQFLRWSERRLGDYGWTFTDNRRIKDPVEACKYPFKPGDLDHAPDDEIKWLYHETFRAHLRQPLREFREFLNGLERHTRIVGTPEGEKIVPAPLKVGFVDRGDGAGSRLEIIAKRTRGAAPEREEVDEDRAPPENVIAHTTAPTATTAPLATPKLRVLNYTSDPQTPEGKARLNDIKAACRFTQQQWAERDLPSLGRIALELQEAAAVEAGRAARLRADTILTPENQAKERAALEAEAREADAAARYINRTVQSLTRKPAPFGVHTSSLSVQSAPRRPQEGPGRPPGGPAMAPDGTLYDPTTGEILTTQEADNDHA
jgi:hypothetical protein